MLSLDEDTGEVWLNVPAGLALKAGDVLFEIMATGICHTDAYWLANPGCFGNACANSSSEL